MSNRDIYETEEYKGFTIEIQHDEDAMNPREDCEPFGKMICFHKRYSLGDKHSYDADDFRNGNDLIDGFKKGLKEHGIEPVLIFPLYLYDHSGLSMSASNGYPYNDRWDAGCVGFTYADREMVLENYMVKRLSKKVLERAEKLLLSEVETYDQYLKGEVYGYIVDGADGIDSCWGYYGSDFEENGLLESARITIDETISCRRMKHFKQLATWIRNRVPLDKREPCPSFA